MEQIQKHETLAFRLYVTLVVRGLAAAQLMEILSKREQHKIDLPTTPTVNQYRSYRGVCYQIVNDVAGRGDHVAMRWMKRADYRTMLEKGTDPRMLRHTGDRRMKTLDPKIAAALMRKATGELGGRLTYHSNRCE